MTDAPRPPRVVSVKEGLDAWAREAFLVLRETAETYHATITVPELATAVQERSGRATKAPQRTWLNPVLSIVAKACHRQELPPLTALVVGKTDGMVGPAYDEVLTLHEQPAITDAMEREHHAAMARLLCYQTFCPDVPEDATPALSDTLVRSMERTRATAERAAARASAPVRIRSTKPTPAGAADLGTSRRAVAEEPVLSFCPRCFIALPTGGGGCATCE